MLTTVFSSELFMPHGHCYLWQPALVWLQVLSNAGIALAYIFIFATLVYLVRRIENIPFQWMYVAFAIFIVACGITHLFDVVVIWQPVYWADGTVRAVTALASLGTALMLPPLVPKAVALAEAASVAHERGLKLEEANRELAVLLDRTKELEQLKTQFFANVSHELRTPLALILGPTEELSRADNLTASQRRELDVVLRNARALLGQVNDLLDVAKLEAGKLEPEYAEADVASLVRLTGSYFESVASERRIAYQLSTPPAVPAQVDPAKLQRVLLNLLSNAFKFTPEGGHVRCELRVDHSAGAALIEVADSGPGIAPEHRELVFERFRQLEGGTARRFGGTGLGLAIAKEFVELHEGSISLGDAMEGGALVRVQVPLRAPAGAEVRAVPDEPMLADFVLPAAARRSATPASEVGPDAPLVLVVEDNPELNAFIAQGLARRHRVASAGDGREGLRVAEAVGPDVIVTDLMMPGMGGDELVRAVRASPVLHEVPIIVLTAKADDALRLSILRDGAQDYILKPFSAEEVLLRVDHLVSTKRARDVLRGELESKAEDLAELAEEVAHRQRELKTAMESLRVARDQALHASEVKTSFLSMVSHELRTPLTVLRLQIDRLGRALGGRVGEVEERALSRLDGASTRLEQLVDSLLDYARIQAGRLELAIEETDLGALLREVADELRPEAERKALALDVLVPEEAHLVRTDPRLLHLILVNLIANALKFTESGGVTVRLEDAGERRRITVVDTGAGIPAHELARIFEPFEQLEPVRRKHLRGVGLGLAIVREIAHALGAEVSVESQVGLGSAFVVSLADAPV